MTDSHGVEFDIYFSQISGEHTTYATEGEKLHVEGEHAGKYTYFKLRDKFRRYF